MTEKGEKWEGRGGLRSRSTEVGFAAGKSKTVVQHGKLEVNFTNFESYSLTGEINLLNLEL